jgi:hypothetical protein
MLISMSLLRTLYLHEWATTAIPRHDRYLTAPTLLLQLALFTTLNGTGCFAAFACRKRMWAIMGYVLLLFVSYPSGFHWSRLPVHFRFRDALPAIAECRMRFQSQGIASTLYVPADSPTSGPVLIWGEEVMLDKDADFILLMGASIGADGIHRSRFGSFLFNEANQTLHHESWGLLSFDGLYGGRLCFRDESGRLIFTSELLWPCAWRLDSPNWTLLIAQPPK